MTFRPEVAHPGAVTLLGIPLDENSSLHRGPAQAPAQVRAWLASGTSNWSAEDGTDLSDEPRWTDAGDVVMGTGVAAITDIEAAVDAGADVVELNPTRDPVGATTAVAAKLVKELAARLLRSSGIMKSHA